MREYLTNAGLYEGKYQEIRENLEAEFPLEFITRMVAQGFLEESKCSSLFSEWDQVNSYAATEKLWVDYSSKGSSKGSMEFLGNNCGNNYGLVLRVILPMV